MAQRRKTATTLCMGLALALPACGIGSDAPEPAEGAIRVAFQDVEAPEVLQREGRARRAENGTAGGLWGVLSGLRRPERALVRNLDSGAEVEVALYGGSAGRDAMMSLSPAASDLLGILDEPVPVRVVALRREPQIVQP
jgi:hypothetical protein